MAAPRVYEPEHPALLAQEAWIARHRLEDAQTFFENFRDYVDSGDLDLMLTLFMDVLSERKTALRKHR